VATLRPKPTMPPEMEVWIERAVNVIVVAMLVLLVLLALISVARLLTGD
jgi:hypothetical protein